MLRERLGCRPPTDAELCLEMGMSERALQRVALLEGRTTLQLEDPIAGGSSSNGRMAKAWGGAETASRRPLFESLQVSQR